MYVLSLVQISALVHLLQKLQLEQGSLAPAVRYNLTPLLISHLQQVDGLELDILQLGVNVVVLLLQLHHGHVERSHAQAATIQLSKLQYIYCSNFILRS